MGLLSIFKRRSDNAPAPAASEPVDAVQRARVLARQRLIGAVVLVLIGIVGFPLVFETQPRPIPVDIPIELPRKDSAPPLVMPAAPPSATVAAADVPTPPGDMITESREDAGRELPAAAVVAKPQSKPASRPDPKTEAARTDSKPATNKSPALAAAAAKPEFRTADAERARELLDGKPVSTAAAAASSRFVVQVGAFSDAAAAHETRVKVEKLGMKTYTQIASTASGNRIRVRVGPFGTRDEADKALAKARSAGLSAVVLGL
jgi:DedD protein